MPGQRVLCRTALLGAVLGTLGPSAVSAHDESTSATQDSFGYRARNLEAPFTDVRAAARLLPLGDKGGVNVPVGFTFRFYGEPYTSVGVTSEGYLTFGGPVTNTPLPLGDPTAPNALIAPFWANLDVTKNPAATIHFATQGAAPARRFVVQWTDVPLAADAASRLTFQVQLHEGTGRITFAYAKLRNGDGSSGGPAGGGAATIGIENATGTVGLTLSRLLPGAVGEGEGFAIEQGAVPSPTLSVRSGLAAPGTVVTLPIDLSGPIHGARGLQAVLRATARTAGAPALAVRALQRGPQLPGDQGYVSAPDLASPGPLRLVLPVTLPLGDQVPAADAPVTVGRVELVVPPGAAPGTAYTIALEELIVAGKRGRVDVAARAGQLTVAATSPPATVKRIEIIAPPQLDTGSQGTLSVVALGEGRPIPGVPIALLVTDPAVLALASAAGVTDLSGRLDVPILASSAGRVAVAASSAGLDEAREEVRVLDPAPPVITSQPPLQALVGNVYRYAITTEPAGLPFELEQGPPGLSLSAGVVSWIPTADDVGSHSVIVRSPDTALRQSYTLAVEAVPVVSLPNERPQITSTPPPTTVEVGATFSYQVTATDPDGDPLAFSLDLQTSPGIAIDSASGAVTYTPAAAEVGEQRALVLVSDGRGGLDGQGLVFRSPQSSPTSRPSSPLNRLSRPKQVRTTATSWSPATRRIHRSRTS